MRVIYGVDLLASVGIEGGYDRMTHMKLWYNLLYDLRVVVAAAPCGVALFFGV